MADELGAELSLDLDSARREIEAFRREIENELEGAVSSFANEYERAVGNLPSIEPEIEAQAVTDELTRAVQSADTALEVTADTAAITSDLNEAVGAAHPSIEVDTNQMVLDINDAVAGIHPRLDLEIGAGGDIAGDLAGGFDDAQLQAQELADTLSDLGQEGKESGDALGGVSNVSTTLATAFSAARGDGRKLVSDLAQIKGGFGGLATGALALSAGFTALFAAGERSIATAERLDVVLGDAAQRIETIDVGGLNGDLSELAIRAGVSGGALRNAAASAAQVGLSAGKSKKEVTDFSNNVNALALRAVVLNPALGEAGAVAERLNTVLARGGRFLNRYGLDLTSAEITTRALADTGKTAVRDLTLFERSVAGANIAVEKLGTNLGKDFEKGAATATVRLSSIRAELNSAFARAGKPLVEPTIAAFESLAEAGAEISVVLGGIGEAVLPVVAAGMGTLGKAAGAVAEVLGALPGEALAAAAAFVILQRAMATTTATTGQLSLFGTQAVSNLERVKTAASTAMQSTAARSVGALVAVTALDAGLGALGTSTEELGVQMTTTGAAIGFAIGGPAGAGIGAGIGAVADGVKYLSGQMTALEEATIKVDRQFDVAEQASAGLGEALFKSATTTVALSEGVANLDINLAKFLRNSSAFAALNLDDDLDRLGLSVFQVVDLLGQGEEGFAKFIAKAEASGEVSLNVAQQYAKNFSFTEVGDGAGDVLRRVDEMDRGLKRTAETSIEVESAAIQIKRELDRLGISANLTGEEFAGLTREQQRNVTAALEAQGSNTKLLTAFAATQRATKAAAREEFNLFVETNRLGPTIRRAALEKGRDAQGNRDWVKTFTIVGDAARGILPEFGGLTAESGLMQRNLRDVSAAADAAAKSIPGVGDALSRALGNVSVFNNAFGADWLGTDELVFALSQTEGEVKGFFDDIAVIAESGAENTATALLTLGPSNVGARMAADLAANQPLFREGMERAFEGIAQAQIYGEAILETLKARVDFLVGAIGNAPLRKTLEDAFGTTDITSIPTAALAEFVRVMGPLGGAGAKAFLDAIDREIVSRKVAGLDVGPLEDPMYKVADETVPTVMGRIADGLNAGAEGYIPALVEKTAQAAATFPNSLEAVQPEVLAAVSQIGQIVAGGATKSADEWNTEFSKIKGYTTLTLNGVLVLVNDKTGEITNAVTGSIIEGISGAEAAAVSRAQGLGFAIVGGIAFGITRNQADEYALQSHIDDLLDAAGRAAGQGSPAKAFIPLGRDIVDGIAVGVRNATSLNDAMNGQINAARGLGGGGGFGGSPTPPAGVSPMAVQVVLDPSMLSGSVDNSISVGNVHNYGPDPDSRGHGLVGALRDLQFTGGAF